MSINNCILKTLNLKDQNIKFSEDLLLFTAVLTLKIKEILLK